jgi:hypothetical protein
MILPATNSITMVQKLATKTTITAFITSLRILPPSAIFYIYHYINKCLGKKESLLCSFTPLHFGQQIFIPFASPNNLYG